SGPVVKQVASFFKRSRSASRTAAELKAKCASVSVRPQALRIASEMLTSDCCGSSPGFSAAGAGAGVGAGFSAGGGVSGSGACLAHPTAKAAQTRSVAGRMRDVIEVDSLFEEKLFLEVLTSTRTSAQRKSRRRVGKTNA